MIAVNGMTVVDQNLTEGQLLIDEMLAARQSVITIVRSQVEPRDIALDVSSWEPPAPSTALANGCAAYILNCWRIRRGTLKFRQTTVALVLEGCSSVAIRATLGTGSSILCLWENILEHSLSPFPFAASVRQFTSWFPDHFYIPPK